MTSRVVVVTGGARGIGRGVVDRFLAGGASVVVLDNEPSAIEELTSAHAAAQDRLLALVGDVADPRVWRDLVARTHARWGLIGVLVNNAAISPKRNGVRVPSHEVSAQEWDDVLRVNMTGPFVAFQAVIGDMRAQRWGRIINMSSGAARMGARVAGVHYGVTKAGILGLTRSLAWEYGHDGITVNAIAPGRILTPMAAAVSDEVNATFLAQIPVGRLGTPDDIAGTVVFLASDDGAFITGATIDVNGGGFIG